MKNLRAFKKFTPLSSQQRSSKAGGSGLGLAIAHDLVNLHGGTIELLYTGNTGSCFKIYIPDQESPINSGDENADDFATKDKQIVA